MVSPGIPLVALIESMVGIGRISKVSVLSAYPLRVATVIVPPVAPAGTFTVTDVPSGLTK